MRVAHIMPACVPGPPWLRLGSWRSQAPRLVWDLCTWGSQARRQTTSPRQTQIGLEAAALQQGVCACAQRTRPESEHHSGMRARGAASSSGGADPR
jgi:hypothetical protein